MILYEIIDFLEWAKEEGHLQFPESRKVDMAKAYINEQEEVNKTCNMPLVIGSCRGDNLTPDGKCRKYGGECTKGKCDYYR